MSLSISSLFGSYYVGSSNNSSNMFAGGIYSSLSELSSIRSGSYKKLLDSYYAKVGNQDGNTSAVNNAVNNSSVMQKKQLSEVKDAADELYKSASKLTSTGSDSLFMKADSVTEDIISAVKSYVKDYNSLIEETGDVSNKSVSGKVNFMTSQVSAYKSSMNNIGITINDDKTLSVDEETLKKANISDVKSLFNGTNSLAYQTSVRAVNVGNAAGFANNSAALYGSDGTAYTDYYRSAYNWYL